ncbi:MAG: hypothetical protein ACI4I9_08765 [Porcipelethomonas sp.]
MKRYEMFAQWLDELLENELPDGIIAFNFNLYDGEENTYDIQLIGSDKFSEDDYDWACSEVYSSEEDVCYVDVEDDIEDWHAAQKLFEFWVKKYIDEGKYSEKLKKSKAVGIGFIDGDIDIVYRA